MREGHHHIKYRSMPNHSRFGLFSWPLHDESCYNQEELDLRQKLLLLRSESGINPELLETSNSWFATNDETAFQNINAGSWVLGNEYRPRQNLRRDDFHIPLQQRQVNWPSINTMTRHIGDYLILRNSELSEAHLNQPMNYVLLDVVQILNKLSLIADGEYVSDQLQLLRKYIRKIEIQIPPTQGSDRLFFADCRKTLEQDIQSDIEQKLQSRLLKDHFDKIQFQLNRVAELRHTVLHFALAAEPVNPHPYWENFKALHDKSDMTNKEFPTLAAKSCASQGSNALIEKLPEHSTIASIATIKLTENSIDQCQDLKFINNLPGQIKESYGKALADLQEIVKFQNILEQLGQVFDKAGEVFTVVQFREQMHNLLEGMGRFVQQSELHIQDVLEANSKAYHQKIQEKQDLNLWEKWVSSKPKQLDEFINNQDNLARFPTSSAELAEAGKELMQHVNEVIIKVQEGGSEHKQLEMISSTRELLQQVMNSMHAWVENQNLLNGLPSTKSPLLAADNLVESTKSNSIQEEQLPSPLNQNNLCDENKALPSTSLPVTQSASMFFQPAKADLLLPQNNCVNTLGTGHTVCTQPPQISTCNNNQCETSQSTIQTNTAALALGAVIILPLGIIALKLIYDWWCKPLIIEQNSDPVTFNKLSKMTGDLLSIAKPLVDDSEDPLLTKHLDVINEEFENCNTNAASSKKYDSSQMLSLFEELTELINDLENPEEEDDDLESESGSLSCKVA